MINYKKSEFTEEEIIEIAEKIGDDFGLLISLYMNHHNTDRIDIKSTDPDGVISKFEILRVEQFDDKKEKEFDKFDHDSDFPQLDKDGCVYWDEVIRNGG